MQNRVQETTTTGGTGTITLAGAVTGYITFAAGFTTGDVLFYTIDNGIGEWEIGIGTLVTTGTLSRTTVIASSNSGALVNFSSGTKRVFCSAPTRSLVPDQDSKSGYVLTTDGTNPSWTQTLNSVNIGNTTAGTGAFTTLSASSTVSGTGFSNYLASPPAIGGSSPAAGNFTNLGYTGTLTGGTGVINIGSGQIVKNASGVVTIGSAISLDPTTANALVVNSSGNVGIGTASSSGRFTLKGSGATAGTSSIYVTNSTPVYTFVVNDDGSFYTGASPAGAPYNVTTGTGANLVVTSAGQLQRSTSSLKYKTDVQDATHGLADALKLRAVTYKGKNDGSTVFGGLIAEEVHEAGLTEFVQYAEDGSPDALSYGNMVSLAFKAIQELHAEIESLKQRTH
jgi:hypothetical protein